MRRLAILTATAAILAGFGGAGQARAWQAPDPFAYMSADSPGFKEYRSLIQRLDDSGSTIVLIQRTFLGRVRILSVARGKVRETVISPNTGEIRRDIILGDFNPASIFGNGQGPGKNGNGNGGNNGNRGNSGGNGGGNGNGGGSGGGGGNGGGGGGGGHGR